MFKARKGVFSVVTSLADSLIFTRPAIFIVVQVDTQASIKRHIRHLRGAQHDQVADGSSL